MSGDLALNGQLVEGHFQSKNYATNVSGWRITADGDVEFGSGVFRGSITATSGTITGSLEILEGGNIRSGQTAYDTGTGFYLGNDGGTPKLSLGSATTSLKWTGTSLLIEGTSTTGTLFAVGGNSLTSGTAFQVTSGSTSSAARSLILIANTSTAATGTTCLFIQQDANKVALQITAQVISDNALSVVGSSLTTGSLGYFYSNAPSTSTRNLVEIINDNSAAVGTTPLMIQQDAEPDTGFHKVAKLSGTDIWIGEGDNYPPGNLTGATGDICFNAINGAAAYCITGTTWSYFAKPRAIFLHPYLTGGSLSNYNEFPFAELPDASTVTAYSSFVVPQDLSRIVSVRMFWSCSLTTGYVFLSFSARKGTSTDAIAAAQYTPNGSANVILKTDITAVMGLDLSESSFIGLTCIRDGGNASDTTAASIRVYGFEIIYS